MLRIIFWETTAACNLECRHCRRLDLASSEQPEDLSFDEAKNIISQIASGYKPILILSGGEPLIRRDIFEIASFASVQGMRTALASNGTLITPEVARNIKKAGIARVSVSLDGASAKTHNAFRLLESSFEDALRGIRNIKNEGIPAQINCAISKHNAHEIEDIFRLAKEIGADALHIFLLVPVGCGVELMEEQTLSPDEYERTLSKFLEMSLAAEIETRATCAPHYQRILREKIKDPALTPEHRGKIAKLFSKGCLAGQSACFISHKGEVFPCGYFPVSCGDLRKQTFREIWEKSEVFQRLRDSNLLGGKCGACEFKEVCMGCRARAYGKCGDYMAEEPYCIYQPR